MKPGFYDGILSKEYLTIKTWSETGNDIDIGREVETKSETEKFRLRDGILTLEENLNLCMSVYKLYNQRLTKLLAFAKKGKLTENFKNGEKLVQKMLRFNLTLFFRTPFKFWKKFSKNSDRTQLKAYRFLFVLVNGQAEPLLELLVKDPREFEINLKLVKFETTEKLKNAKKCVGFLKHVLRSRSK